MTFDPARVSFAELLDVFIEQPRSDEPWTGEGRTWGYAVPVGHFLS